MVALVTGASGAGSSEHEDDPPVGELRNLGPRSVERLRDVGIERLSDLEAAGAVGAYERLVAAGGRGLTVMMLWSLEGALRGVDWRDLPPADRRRLSAVRAALLRRG